MSYSGFDAKEQVRQAIDIVDLVGQYLQLRREGRIFKALCPWHDDSRPSLQVDPNRQSWKCWVCNDGGDLFSFVMKMEKVEFREALEMLAERAGISLRQEPTNSRSAQPGSPDDKRTLYKAMAWAEEQYHRCLLDSPDGDAGRRYFDERGISEDSIVRYQLGFAPPAWDWLLGRARTAGFTDKVLERVGLVRPRQTGGGYYDYFRGRVLFSIRDAQSRPVALGGRILPQFADDATGKYINSPETPLFSKSKVLYGLDTAREAISKSRTAVVMEGYTDVVIARQFGIGNSVCVMGTALTDRHIQVLRHYADSITLVLDGDEAGQRRTNEILELFIAQQVDLRVATLPDGLDPCDFLLQRGAAYFRNSLDDAADALDHAYLVATRGLDIARQPHEASRAIDSLLQTIAKAPRLAASTTSEHLIREATMLTRLARMFQVEEALLRQRMSELRRGQKPKPHAAFVAQEPVKLTPWERELLETVLLAPKSVAALAEQICADDFDSPHLRAIFTRCCELVHEGLTPDFDRLMLEFDDPQIKNLLVDVAEEAQLKNTGDTAARLQGLFTWRRHRQEERDIQTHTRALREQNLSDAEALSVLEQLIQQERNRQGISAPTEG